MTDLSIIKVHCNSSHQSHYGYQKKYCSHILIKNVMKGITAKINKMLQLYIVAIPLKCEERMPYIFLFIQK